MRREEMLRRVKERSTQDRAWDVAIIGGGATGVGVAVDAAARGLDAVLVEAHGFGKGTSSRSTKLVHGGVRYLEQGNIPLVISALRERELLRQNAPHLVHDLTFVVPNYAWWEAPFYGIGLKVYDVLAGRSGFGASKILNKKETLQRLPTLNPNGLRGGVAYHDGQFDDARLLIHLAMTAADCGATLLNYCPAIGMLRDAEGLLNGLTAHDEETGETLTIRARVVVNAAGVFTDSVRHMADTNAESLTMCSQGIHLVFDRSFLKSDAALMVPRTKDGRVLFVIPWHGHAVAGTTDTPVASPSLEPRPLDEEIQFILETAGLYLSRPPSRADVLAVYVGLRPLVKGKGKTSTLSRDHVIRVDSSGLLTITGGKWTTYRRMAEDCVDRAIKLGGLRNEPCRTKNLKVHGYMDPIDETHCNDALGVYGSDAAAIHALAQSPALAVQLHPDLPYIVAEVVWAAREEMARTVEDVLARHTRALFLNARAAQAMAEPVAKLLAAELGRDAAWAAAQAESFVMLANQYMV
jgi:glycerol-3-phosphate dehydrogenase